jgi:hypothetical protein
MGTVSRSLPLQAECHGVSWTWRALRLDYYGLCLLTQSLRNEILAKELMLHLL